mmetsp:Transcript_62300/g.147630  ORF Transcript_62300/g.147630 Transcript_62300/m.147630 type:complete len:122 (-) Transcript_62300:1577-1942(-)
MLLVNMALFGTTFNYPEEVGMAACAQAVVVMVFYAVQWLILAPQETKADEGEDGTELQGVDSSRQRHATPINQLPAADRGAGGSVWDGQGTLQLVPNPLPPPHLRNRLADPESFNPVRERM